MRIIERNKNGFINKYYYEKRVNKLNFDEYLKLNRKKILKREYKNFIRNQVDNYDNDYLTNDKIFNIVNEMIEKIDLCENVKSSIKWIHYHTDLIDLILVRANVYLQFAKMNLEFINKFISKINNYYKEDYYFNHILEYRDMIAQKQELEKELNKVELQTTQRKRIKI